MTTIDAALKELKTELAEARDAVKQQADAMRVLASVKTELEAARTQAAARTEQARSAEARVQEMQVQLEAAQTERQPAGEPAMASTAEAEDLALMLNAAERGVTGIMERARHDYEEQLTQAERVRETIQADIGRFADWHYDVEPLIRSVQQGIETARGRITRIPDQISAAVDSMTNAMMAVSDSLDRLATLPGPLSGDAIRVGGESVGTPAETVIRIPVDDPVTPPAFISPAGAPESEDPQRDRSEGRSTGDGSADAGDESDEITHEGSLRNHHG